MSDAIGKMMENIKIKTGKSFEHWVKLVKQQSFEKHGQKIKFLKDNHGFTHGYANLVAHKTKEENDELNAAEDMVVNQYKGKEHHLPIYETLKKAISKFGNDVEFAPKKSYVSLRRKKQFGCLNPASKSRFEIGINLKGHTGKGILEVVNRSNAMFSHKINIENKSQISEELIDWLKLAYENAG